MSSATLNIVVSTGDAAKRIKRLTKAMNSLATAAAAFQGSSSKGLQRLAKAIAGIKPINPSVIKSAYALQNALSKVGASAGLSQTASSLAQISNKSANAVLGLSSVQRILHIIQASAAALVFKRMASAIFTAGKNMQQFGLAMRTIGTAGETMKTLTDRIKTLANETGTDVNGMAQQFQQFAIAANQSGISVKTSENIFKQFSVALRVLGKDSNSQRLAFLALTQMISKGKVQSEELRRQLAEQLPGAFELFAQAAGVSTAQLDTMMRNGEALSKDILPKVAALLEKRYGPALAAAMKTPVAQINVLRNHMTELMDILARGVSGNRGFFPGLTDVITSLNRVMSSGAVKAFAVILGEIAGISFNIIAGALDAIAVALESVSALVTGVIDALQALADVTGISALASAIGGVASTFNSFVGDITGGITAIGLLTDAVGVYALVSSAMWIANSAAGKIAIGAWQVLRGAIMGVTASTVTATGAIGIMSRAYTAFMAVVKSSGIGLVLTAGALALGELVNEFQKSRAAAAAFEKKIKVSQKSLIEANAGLKTYAAELKKIASATGLSADATDKWVASMVKAAAGPEELSKALEKEIAALQKKSAVENNAVIISENRIKALKRLVSEGDTSTATRNAIKSLIEYRDTLLEQTSETKRLLAIKQQMQIGYKKEAEAAKTAGNAAGGAAAGYKNFNTTVGATTGAVSGVKTSVDAANVSLNTSVTNAKTLATNLQALSDKSYPVKLEGLTNKAVEQKVSVINTAFDDATIHVQAFQDSLQTLSDNTATYNTSLQDTVNIVTQQRGAFVAMAEALSNADSTMTTLGTTLQTTMKSFSTNASVGSTAIATLGGSIDAATAGMGDLASESETTANTLSSTMDDPINKMQDLRQAILDAAAAYGRFNAARSSAGAGREGGISTALTQTVPVTASTFSGNIPQLSEGTTNTNVFPKRSAGGIPTILHPNEAVIPLSRGREVPVQLNTPYNKRLSEQVSNLSQQISFKNDNKQNIQRQSEDTRNGSKERPITVNLTISAIDASSFKNSENQVLREFAVKLGRAIQQFG